MTDHRNPEFQVPERDRPTRPQMRLLRSLAEETGQSFAWPRTKAEASAQIARLTRGRSGTQAEFGNDRMSVDDGGVRSATAIRHDEIVGFGSTARWR